MTQSIAAIVIASVMAACGGQTPVAPSALSAVAETPATVPVPGTVVPAPAAPDPPPPAAPVPPPVAGPTPYPKPKDSQVRQATMTDAHWYSNVVGLPASFDVVTTADVITFGPCPPTAILIQTATSLFAQPCGANVQIVDQMWTYSGVLGQAAGTIE